MEKTPEQNIQYWQDVQRDPQHPHRKKFSNGFTDIQIFDYCSKMIELNELDLKVKEVA